MPLNKQALQQQYHKELERLNAAQRQAVDQLEGPVLVVAGPGTGKTQILSMRIGRILQETDAGPQNILCLTFTDNGRTEMRNRLFRFIGPEAYQIPIHTFHSFCNEVIQENLSYFGRLALEPISELEEIELFKDLVDHIDADSPLKRFKGEVYYDIPRLKNLFRLMKKEAWEPEYLCNCIDKYIDELPTKEGFFYKRKYKEFKAGDPNPKKIEAEQEKMETLRAAVNLYPVYMQMMQERSRYTFDDMIIWVLDAFKNNPDMLLDYQERYLYMLVDEFQDTSGSQNKLLNYLSGYWEVPNVFAVGDDDQSIFSFQDANVENMRAFARKYGEALAKIVLTENYRSTQSILDLARELIEHNKERIIYEDASLSKILKAANESLAGLSIRPRIIEYPNPVHEAADVAARIEKLLEKTVSAEEIAVIYRNHAQAELLLEFLKKKNIPINMRKVQNLLELPFAKKILKILQYLEMERDMPYSGDELLFEILHYNFFHIQPIEIAKLSVAVAQNNYSNRKEKYSLRRALSEQPESAQPTLFDNPEKTSLKKISNKLESLLSDMDSLTLQELLEEVIRRMDILKFVMQSPEKPWLIQILTSLFDFVKQETKRQPEMSLQGLINIIELMRSNKLSIPVEKILNNEKGVSLITAHSSKGSEYEYVFIIGCSENAWDKKKNNNYSFSMPDNLYSTTSDTDELEESRRLFYVGITRAKKYLQLSYPLKDNNEKDMVRSVFVSQIISDCELEPEQVQVSEEQLTDYLALQFMASSKPEIALVEKHYISELLKNYSLSVTHLSNFLQCPLKFYYQNLIKVPAAKSESLTFGSATHFALQRLFEKMKANKDTFPSKEEMLEDFNWYMRRNRESFTREQFQRRMEYGAKILPAYYDFYINDWHKVVSLERNIRNVVIEGVPINGKLDKLEFNGKEINVVDYKTGKYANAKKKLLPPSVDNPNGGDYWRQAVFYKILLDNEPGTQWRAVSSEFDFVEPVKDEYKTEKVIITPEDIAIVTKQIRETWARIQQHDFTKGCGEPDCDWCNFVKDNELQVALHELMEEEE